MTNAGLNGPVVSIFVDDIKIMASKESNIIEYVKAKLTFIFWMLIWGQSASI